MKQKKNSKAFTLAEVLIALGIIGIVAAMTIPSLMQNINNKQLITATNNFNRRFGEALKIMNSQGVLAGRKTTQGFLDELSKVFKVAKVCDNTKLDQCFSKNITWGDKVKEISNFKTANDIVEFSSGGSKWNTDVMGVQFANGVSALIAYNPNCQQDSGNTNLIQVGGDKGSISFSTNNCIAMIYDVNSNKKPNTIENDIKRTSNIKNFNYIAVINGVKIPKVVNKASVQGVTYGENGWPSCEEFKKQYGTSYCCEKNDPSGYCKGGDYWAGAVAACGGKDKLISVNEIDKLAQDYYGNSETKSKNLSVSQEKQDEFSSYGFPSSFCLWSNFEHNATDASMRGIHLTDISAARNSRGWSNHCMAVCVEK